MTNLLFLFFLLSSLFFLSSSDSTWTAPLMVMAFSSAGAENTFWLDDILAGPRR